MTLKPFCHSFGVGVIDRHDKIHLLTSDEWDEMEKIIKVLKWPFVLTKELQSDRLTLSDVYGLWVKMNIKLRKENHPLANILKRHLFRREALVLKHKTMIAAIYLDPRYNGLLSVDEQETAICLLENLWTRLNRNDSQCAQDSESVEQELLSNNECNMDSDLLAFVQSTDQRMSMNAQPKSVRSQAISFYKTETMKNVLNSKSILDYWSGTVRHEYNTLYELSQVLLSVPATQVSVERAFSSLRFILTDYRQRIADEALENILLMRLNW